MLFACASCFLPAIGRPRAEDLKGRWSLAGGAFFFSTRDSIRSNADILLGPAGDDGVPFTGDPNEDLNCSYGGSYCDPRPDDQIGRSIRISDAVRYDINVSYGAARWLSFRLDAAWSRSSIGPINLFLSDHFPRQNNPADPSTMNAFIDRQFTKSIRAGELTEIPVTASAVIRFRTKRPINPYIIIGAGKIFTEVEWSDDLVAMNDRLGEMRIRGATNEYLRNVVSWRYIDRAPDARIPYIWSMKPSVDNSYEWHLGAGIEYFFNSRISLIFEGRSSFASSNLDLGVGEEDQIDLITWSEKIYRADGSVWIFAPGANAPNPLCKETGYRGIGCDPGGDPSQRVDPEGPDPRTGRAPYICPAIADFDRNGQIDVCYGANIAASDKGVKESRGDVIVQGGKINLSAVSVGINLRFHF